MLETRFSILALGMLSLVAFQVQQHLTSNRMQMILSEVHLVASGVGTEHLDQVNTMDFEEIMDFDDDQRTRHVVFDSDTLSFDLTSSVRFVERQGDVFVTTQEETDYQEVNVTIRGLLNSTVRMSRIYSRVST